MAAKRSKTDELQKKWDANKKSRIFLQLAEEYRKEDSLDAAVAILKEGLNLHPKFHPARVAMARCYLAKREHAKAEAELEQVVSQAPDNPLAGKLYAEVLQEKGERGRALEVLEKLVPFAPDDPEITERIETLKTEMGSASSLPAVGADASATADFGATDFDTQGDNTLGMTDIAMPSQPMDFEAASPSPPAPADDDGDGGVPSPVAEDAPHDPFAAALDEVRAEKEAKASDSATPEMDLSSPPDALLAPKPPTTATSKPGGDDDLTSRTLAELYEAQGSPEKALEIYEAMLVKNPGDVELQDALERCKAAIAPGEIVGDETGIYDGEAIVGDDEPPVVDAPAPEPEPAAEPVAATEPEPEPLPDSALLEPEPEPEPAEEPEPAPAAAAPQEAPDIDLLGSSDPVDDSTEFYGTAMPASPPTPPPTSEGLDPLPPPPPEREPEPAVEPAVLQAWLGEHGRFVEAVRAYRQGRGPGPA